MGTMASYRLERDLLGGHAIYPGHPVVLALLVTHIFPSLAAAATPTEHGWSAALGSNEITGAGDMVSSAMRLLHGVASRTTTIEEAIAWSNKQWRESAAGGHPDRVERGQEQVDRAMPLLQSRLETWPLK